MKPRILLLLAALPLLVAGQPLHLEKTITLSDLGKDLDGLAADVPGQRLFVSAAKSNAVLVIDLAAGRVTRTLMGLHEPHGLLYWPEQKRLYIANGADGHVRAYDGGSFESIADYDFNSDPDQIRIDPKRSEVFVGYGDGAIGVINAELRSSIDKILLDVHPAGFELESEGHRMFINIPGGVSSLVKNGHVIVVDRRTRTIIAKWELEGAKQNFPMALDEANHRLFIGCGRPAKLIVLDTESGKQVGSFDIVGDAAGVSYDAALHRIYVSGGMGAITVLKQNGPDAYELLDTIKTAPGARISLFVPESKRLFLAIPHRGKQAAELRVFAVAE